MKPDARSVAIESIRVPGENMRIDLGDIIELSESIGRHGLLQPLLVTETAKGLLLEGGHRRLAACRRAGLTEVPVIVRKTESTIERLADMYTDNAHGKKLSALEEGRHFARMIREGLTQYEVADMVNHSQTYVSNRLKLLELDSIVQLRVHSGDLSLHAALNPHRTTYEPRGARPADLPERNTEKWDLYHLDRVLRSVEAGDLPFHIPELMNKIRLLKKAINALVLPEICEKCGTVKGYIRQCCTDHDNHLCTACFEATHPEEDVA